MTVVAWDGVSEYDKVAYRKIRIDGEHFLSTTPITVAYLVAAAGRDASYQFFQEQNREEPDTLLLPTDVVRLQDGDRFFAVPPYVVGGVPEPEGRAKMSHDSRYGEECSHGHGWYLFDDGCAVTGCENAPGVEGGVPEQGLRDAAQHVVDDWDVRDDPTVEDADALIERLRAALERPRPAPEPPDLPLGFSERRTVCPTCKGPAIETRVPDEELEYLSTWRAALPLQTGNPAPLQEFERIESRAREIGDYEWFGPDFDRVRAYLTGASK